jgi:hypothetical protein
MQCIAVIIQLVSRDHVCRFESESEMAKWEGLTIIYANRLPWYIVVIIVFSKSHDKSEMFESESEMSMYCQKLSKLPRTNTWNDIHCVIMEYRWESGEDHWAMRIHVFLKLFRTLLSPGTIRPSLLCSL